MKVTRILFSLVVAFVLLATAAGCASPAATPEPAQPAAPAATEKPAEPAAPVATEVPAPKVYTYKDMVVGFLQTGSEGGWRAANSASFKEDRKSVV